MIIAVIILFILLYIGYVFFLLWLNEALKVLKKGNIELTETINKQLDNRIEKANSIGYIDKWTIKNRSN